MWGGFPVRGGSGGVTQVCERDPDVGGVNGEPCGDVGRCVAREVDGATSMDGFKRGGLRDKGGVWGEQRTGFHERGDCSTWEVGFTMLPRGTGVRGRIFNIVGVMPGVARSPEGGITWRFDYVIRFLCGGAGGVFCLRYRDAKT